MLLRLLSLLNDIMHGNHCVWQSGPSKHGLLFNYLSILFSWSVDLSLLAIM